MTEKRLIDFGRLCVECGFNYGGCTHMCNPAVEAWEAPPMPLAEQCPIWQGLEVPKYVFTKLAEVQAENNQLKDAIDKLNRENETLNEIIHEMENEFR